MVYSRVQPIRRTFVSHNACVHGTGIGFKTRAEIKRALGFGAA